MKPCRFRFWNWKSIKFFHKRGFKKLIGVEQSKKAIEIFYKENKNKNLKILNKDIFSIIFQIRNYLFI